jgi:hypothetical protein
MSRLRVVLFMMSFSAAAGRRDVAEGYVTELMCLILDRYCSTYST